MKRKEKEEEGEIIGSCSKYLLSSRGTSLDVV